MIGESFLENFIGICVATFIIAFAIIAIIYKEKNKTLTFWDWLIICILAASPVIILFMTAAGIILYQIYVGFGKL